MYRTGIWVGVSCGFIQVHTAHDRMWVHVRCIPASIVKSRLTWAYATFVVRGEFAGRVNSRHPSSLLLCFPSTFIIDGSHWNLQSQHCGCFDNCIYLISSVRALNSTFSHFVRFCLVHIFRNNTDIINWSQDWWTRFRDHTERIKWTNDRVCLLWFTFLACTKQNVKCVHNVAGWCVLNVFSSVHERSKWNFKRLLSYSCHISGYVYYEKKKIYEQSAPIVIFSVFTHRTQQKTRQTATAIAECACRIAMFVCLCVCCTVRKMIFDGLTNVLCTYAAKAAAAAAAAAQRQTPAVCVSSISWISVLCATNVRWAHFGGSRPSSVVRRASCPHAC